MKIKLLLVAFVVVLSGCKKEETSESVANSEKVLLRLNLEKGFSRLVTYSSNATANGEPMMNEGLGLTVVVDAVSEGTDPQYTFTSIVKYMNMESSVMGEADNYDSSKKVSDMSPSELEWHAELGRFIDKPMTFVLDSRGKIVKSFTADGVRPIDSPIELNNFQIPFPEKEVGIGDSWNGEYPNLLNGAMVKNTYTVTDITDKAVQIAVVSTVPGIEGVMKENKLNGAYSIDRKTGLLLQGTMEGDMTQFDAKMSYTFKTAPLVK